MAGDGGGGGGTNRSLQETPSWALATVCFIFIFLGIFIEHLIHLASHWLKKKKKSALYEAMEKLKTVLMQLGFMSLILTAIQRWIPKICIKLSVANSMLPCRRHAQIKINSADSCASKEMVSLMSQGGINQLNIFIFVLAVMQIVYSLATMGLGRAKMKSWKTWEKETQTVEYMVANDPERFRYTRQTTFWRRHVMTDCTTHRAILWIQCFFRQFFHSVAKVDYFTLRHGFISAHLSTNITFNFRKYIQRSLEDDFKGVIGISPIMWFLVIIFLLVDVHGWNVYLWVSFLPLLIVILVGTKLQVIVARMAMQLANQNTVIKGTPLVQLSNTLFWFNRPQLVLTLLHFTLFMNAFEFSFFIWVTWQFGIHSCYHEHVEIIVTRVVLAVMVQVLCSYITLPLYALVTQMGSQYKSAILEEHTIHAIKQWHANVKHKRKKNHLQQQSPAAGVQDDSWSSGMNSPSPDISTHRRASTFTEFDSRRGGDDREIVEDIEIELQRDHPGNQIQEIRQNEHEFNQRV